MGLQMYGFTNVWVYKCMGLQIFDSRSLGLTQEGHKKEIFVFSIFKSVFQTKRKP